ncbi:MAG TPA: hypothetical protein PKV67_01060 [Hyphomonas sp.]|mgnify:CR=1 FL=1|nr:hypothetical protein [Hyphomonas sp.]
MATGTAGGVGRRYHTKQVHYLTANITVSDEDDSISMGWLPAGAIVTACRVAVFTAFNNSGNDYIKVGHSNDDDEFAASVDVSSVGVKLPTTLATATEVKFSVDTEIFAMYEGSSTAAASPAGSATVVLEFVVP